jgi:L-lactate dehydrogenase
MPEQPRYGATALIEFATALLDRAGLEHEKSAAVAQILVEGDLLGHTTHGLQLLPPYLSDLEKGELAKSGQPRVIADRPAALAWDGNRLPGPWLTAKGIDLACERAATQGSCTVAIRRSHHIACLAAYLLRATERGMMVLLISSSPENQSVAPHGGRAGVMTPNPIAAGWPTDGDPVLLDVSMSITTNGMVGRLKKEGGRLPGKWLIDSEGNPSDDPTVIGNESSGALLPIGGVEYGHKGYALGLLMEALTGGLAGHGRADPVEGWTAEIFIEVFDPRLFAGSKDFLRQTSWMADACRNTAPRRGFDRVRLPGESGLARRKDQLAHGVDLYPSVMPALVPWTRKLGVNPPSAL